MRQHSWTPRAKVDRINVANRTASRNVGPEDPWHRGTAPHATSQTAPQQYDLGAGDRPRPDIRWNFYDEKYLFQEGSLYTGKDGAGWLLRFRDYLAGRTAELDRVFDYIEKASDEMGNDLGFMLQCPSNEEVSKLLWALLAVLLTEHTDSMRRFCNVPRHNGLRACQVMTAPINEDKAEVRRELLKAVTKPNPGEQRGGPREGHGRLEDEQALVHRG